ncbi:MAG: N-glycosylase [Candidatus Altiarchaeales archaeon ex4484_2]|nr:MAG: N-glycosylase [Candidatus Altiarchaeales archaeon ex4484_2]
MDSLVSDVVALRDSWVGELVESRLVEFRKAGSGVPSRLFRELCFCLTTANCGAESCLVVLDEVGDGFLLLPEDELSSRLRELGYRFPNRRASFIVEARSHISSLEGVLSSGDSGEVRDWLVGNVRGLGLKEASHFLRNVGFFDVAIIDFHIIDLLVGKGLIKRPRSLSRRRYLEVEGVLRKIADKAKMSLGELDLYLWYLETGKVLK